MSVDMTGSNQTADPVEQLVGEGKKYKTVADLAKSRLEADNHITQIEAENAALREVVKAKERMSRTEDFDTFLAELRGKPKETETKPVGDNQAKAGLTPQELEQYLEGREKRQRVDASFAAVRGELSKTYGDKTDEVLAKAMKENGLSEDVVKSLAFTSPQVALRALGLAPNATGQSGIQGSVSTEALFGSKPEGRNYAYYKELRAKIGEGAFYEKKVQQQLFKDRIALGDEFYKG
jgi:hypothetical protein